MLNMIKNRLLISAVIMSALLCVVLINVQALPGDKAESEPASAGLGQGIFYDAPAFVFGGENGIALKTTEERSDNIKITAHYPETESFSSNQTISRLVGSRIDDFRARYERGSLDITFKPFRYNDFIIGFVFDIYEYSPEEGLTHTKESVTFDLMGGLTLNIDDLFAEGYDYRKVVPGISNVFAFNSSGIYFYNKAGGEYTETVVPFDSFGGNFQAEQYFLRYFGISGDNGGAESPFMEQEAPDEGVAAYNDSLNVKFVALTFDDGPERTNTPRLLDGLAKYDAKATFFVLGHRLEAMPEIVKKITDEGHALGNHSFNHKQLTKISEKDLHYQIDATNELIFGITGQTTTLLRPPYGAKSKKVLQAAGEKDMTVIMWNIDPKDWIESKSASEISNHIINKVKDGDIILLHDIYKHSVDAALMVVEELSQKGYKFVTVDELITIKQQQIQTGHAYSNGREKPKND